LRWPGTRLSIFNLGPSLSTISYLPFTNPSSDGQPPYATIPLPPLVPQQRYDIYVQLIIPAVESNYALGNFMTSLTVTTPSNQTLASVRQPVSPLSSNFFNSLITRE
jgi:hypothetical protein